MADKPDDHLRKSLDKAAVDNAGNEGIRILQALQLVLDAIVETVEETSGGPSSAIYLALLHHFPALTASGYQKMIDLLVRQGRLTCINHWLEVPLIKK